MTLSLQDRYVTKGVKIRNFITAQLSFLINFLTVVNGGLQTPD